MLVMKIYNKCLKKRVNDTLMTILFLSIFFGMNRFAFAEEPTVWFTKQGSCDFKSRPYHISRSGLGSGITEIQAQKASQKAATKMLTDQFCKMLTDEECTYFSAKISLTESVKHPNKNTYCTVARVPEDSVKDPTGQKQREEQLRQTITKIIERFPKELTKEIYFKSPVLFDSNCMINLDGEILIGQMKEIAIQKGMIITANPTGLIVETKFTPKKDNIWQVEILGFASSLKYQSFGLFDIPRYQSSDNEAFQGCIRSDDSRLKTGDISHSTGLDIEISLGKETRSWCEGEQGAIKIITNQLADIRLFSIFEDPEQKSMLVYAGSVDQTSDNIRYELDLGTITFYPISSIPKEEKMLVLAVPKGKDFGKLNDLQEPCLTFQSLESWLPDDVALQIINYRIYPIGSQIESFQCDWSEKFFEERRKKALQLQEQHTQLIKCQL